MTASTTATDTVYETHRKVVRLDLFCVVKPSSEPQHPSAASDIQGL